MSADAALRIARLDWSVVDDLEAGMPCDPAAIEPLAAHPDVDVRELALLSLAVPNGPVAQRAFLRALSDPAASVRVVAAGCLAARLDHTPFDALLDAFDRCAEPAIRERIALLLGLSPEARLADVDARAHREGYRNVAEALFAARARLGAPGAQAELGSALVASAGPAKLRLLDLAGYAAGPWLLPWARPLLDDTSPLRQVSSDADPGPPRFLRVADAAVVLAATAARQAFSFPAIRGATYSDIEIDEARRFIDGLMSAAR